MNKNVICPYCSSRKKREEKIKGEIVYFCLSCGSRYYPSEAQVGL